MNYCKIHPTQPLLELFTSSVCDLCSPPQAKDISAWEPGKKCPEGARTRPTFPDIDMDPPKEPVWPSITGSVVFGQDYGYHGYEMVWAAKDENGVYSVYHSPEPMQVTPAAPGTDWDDQELISDLYR